MALIGFLKDLFHTGRIQVLGGAAGPMTAAEEALLRAAERGHRSLLAPPLPELDAAAAGVGARLLYLCAQSIATRAIEAAALSRSLIELEETLNSDAVARHYSVDLCLCALPELAVIARRLARSDPVLEVFAELGARWPLSSVGMAEVPAPEKLDFWDHPGMRRLYLDRVFERGDRRRAARPAFVQEALRADLGAHKDLAPELLGAADPKVAHG